MEEKEKLQKAKAIKEMAEAVVCSAIVSKAKIDDKVAINLNKFIENMIRIGYRKLPEDSVVLSREEYIDLSRNYVGEQVAQARKETAEKIYTKIKDSFLMNSNNRYALKLWIEEQFGLEIKE